MHRDKQKIHARPIAVTILAVFLLGGCAQMKEFFLGPSTSSPSSATSRASETHSADFYLKELHKLATGDVAAQAEILADTEAAATLIQEPSTILRFALVLGTPGHAGFDPERAQGLLRELLAKTELMTETEISLATIHLKAAEEFVVLGANARSAQTAVDQRLATAWADNDRLKRELEEAEHKLDAITSIERSIREQDP